MLSKTFMYKTETGPSSESRLCSGLYKTGSGLKFLFKKGLHLYSIIL